jgi:DNA polymerase-1
MFSWSTDRPFVYRAYFQSINQDPKYNYRSDGVPTGAVRLFATKIYQFIKEGAVGIMPTHSASSSTRPRRRSARRSTPTTRRRGARRRTSSKPQFPLMRAAVQAFALVPIEKTGYEADDLIATYACEARDAGAEVLIISSDKDLMQLVSDRVLLRLRVGAKGRPGYRPERRIDRQGVIEYFGVPPEKVIDVQALVGDTSDNVPGVPGIGVKTAAALIRSTATSRRCWRAPARSSSQAARAADPLRRAGAPVEAAGDARLQRRIEAPLGRLRVPSLDPAESCSPSSRRWSSARSTKRVARTASVPMHDGRGRSAAESRQRAGWTAARTDDGAPRPAPDGHSATASGRGAAARRRRAVGEPAAGRGAGAAAAMPRLPIDARKYETVGQPERLDDMDGRGAYGSGASPSTRRRLARSNARRLVGVSLATAPGKAAYIPLAHAQRRDDLLGGGAGRPDAGSGGDPAPEARSSRTRR